jgi:arginyl-tRNA synthetase
MKETIRRLVKEALERAVKQDLAGLDDINGIDIEVSRTKDPKFGDYSTNVAMVMAKKAGTRPRDLAAIIVDCMETRDAVVSGVEIAGPGFINFTISRDLWEKRLRDIHKSQAFYGCRPRSSGPKVLLEFVSANPTGPLHVGHGRGAAVGDTLARLMRTCGYEIETEYYVNDAGNQMRILGRSTLLRMKQISGEIIEFPDDHYKGEYIRELASQLLGSPLGEEISKSDDETALELAARYACGRILDGIKEDLRTFGVVYDNYFSETTLHEIGAIGKTAQKLKDHGKVEERDGALWFKMEGQEDDKDRVLVRATGAPTYFAADAAYHENKFARGYDLLLDIWGADHHGYAPRVKAAMEALGRPADRLKILLVQFVTLVREGEKISMSTRSGKFITLKEVLDEVGPDAARFFFLTKRCDSHLDFDLELAKRASKDNPVYYVQYVHARVASVFRIASERGISTEMTDPDLSLLSLPEELNIIKRLADFPDTLLEAAEALEPHRVTFYLMELAELFHAYYHDNRILTEDEDLKKARLFLAEAVRQVVANGLGILGVSAPDRM